MPYKEDPKPINQQFYRDLVGVIMKYEREIDNNSILCILSQLVGTISSNLKYQGINPDAIDEEIRLNVAEGENNTNDAFRGKFN